MSDVLRDFWYIVAESRELGPGQSLSRVVLDEWLAIFRDENGKAVALLDRCLHRAAQLSRGKVEKGQLKCPYHGWTYDGQGSVVQIPSMGPKQNLTGQAESKPSKCAVRFETREQDDYIYVRLNAQPTMQVEPYPMPNYKEKGYRTIRLINEMENTVTNCAENFVDIPHTSFVHPRIFRDQREPQRLVAKVTRANGSVFIDYKNETDNFGIFSWFLNPDGTEIQHTDEFIMPNVTCVQYRFGSGKHFIITSQSVPLSAERTLVYTDLTYNYGLWNWIAAPLIRRQGQAIIDQDVEILANQMKSIRKYGDKFQNTPSDVIHTYIEAIRSELEQGRDPRALPAREIEIEFWI